MATADYTLTATLWLYPGESASWHFLSLPKQTAKEIRAKSVVKKRRGFGSVRVSVMIGETTWSTSIFPSKVDDTYILPVKASVRKKECIEAGDSVTFALTII